MRMAAFAFSLRYYLRSYRYAAPLLVYGWAVHFIYGIVPNPIMPSYALTTALLFAIMAWLAFGFVDAEDETQQMLSALHLRGISRYYASKFAVMALFAVFLSVVATAYPAIFDKMSRTPTAIELALASLGHVASALLGAAIGAMFTSKLMRKLLYAVPGLFLAVALGFAGSGIQHELPPAFHFAVWLLPPVFRIVEAFDRYETGSAAGALLWLLWTLVYGTAIFGLFLALMRKRLF